MGVQEGFSDLNGSARNVDSENIFSILIKPSSGFICETLFVYIYNGVPKRNGNGNGKPPEKWLPKSIAIFKL